MRGLEVLSGIPRFGSGERSFRRAVTCRPGGARARECDIADRTWHDSCVPVLMLIAIAVVLVGIFFVATGRGGELAYEQADHAPLDLGPVSSADIALLRPPSAMWGYNMQVTDAALDQIARAMRERDVTIAYLQDQLAGVQRNGGYTVPRGAHARPGSAPTPPDAFVPLEAPDPSEARNPFEAPEAFEVPGAFEVPEDPQPQQPYQALQPYEKQPPFKTQPSPQYQQHFETPEDFQAPDEFQAPEKLADPE